MIKEAFNLFGKYKVLESATRNSSSNKIRLYLKEQMKQK